MLQVFLKTLEQTSILLIFILIGYFFCKKGIVNESGKKVLASLLVNLFAPAYNITSLSRQISIDNIVNYLTYFAVGAAVTVVAIFVAIPFAKVLGKDKLQKNILKYALAFGNIGYFGYPVIGAVFGEATKAAMILFCVPMTIGIQTYGWQVLTASVKEVEETEKTGKLSFKQRFRFLFSVPFIGTIIGITLGLLPFSVPDFVVNLCTVAGNCQSAAAMILTGMVLSSVPMSKLFSTWKPYLIGIIRLLVIPVIFGGVVYLCGVRDILFMLTTVAVAMPVGMNVVVFPEAAGMDSTEGAKMCFISYILALAALPLVFSLIQMLMVV